MQITLNSINPSIIIALIYTFFVFIFICMLCCSIRRHLLRGICTNGILTIYLVGGVSQSTAPYFHCPHLRKFTNSGEQITLPHLILFVQIVVVVLFFYPYPSIYQIFASLCVVAGIQISPNHIDRFIPFSGNNKIKLQLKQF